MPNNASRGIFYASTPSGLVLALKVQPGARSSRVGPVVAAASRPGWPARRLRVAVTTVAEGGRANVAVLHAVADWLSVRPGCLSVQAGIAARDKLVLVAGATAEEFASVFAAMPLRD